MRVPCHRRRVLGALALFVATPARSAVAAPPGTVSVAVERLFGVSRLTLDEGSGASYSDTSLSLFSPVSGRAGYSAPRLALDFMTPSGVSIGGAVGYQSDGLDGPGDAWLLAPRVGYFARPSRDFGVWPRAGITHLAFDYGGGFDDTLTALTLEVPLVFMVSGAAAIVLTPHADIGISGGDDDRDQRLTELGLHFGMGLFF